MRRLHKFLHSGLWVTDAPVLATAIAHGALVSISRKNIYMVIFYTSIETKKKYFIFRLLAMFYILQLPILTLFLASNRHHPSAILCKVNS